MLKYRKLVKLGKSFLKDWEENEEKFVTSQSEGNEADADSYYHRSIRMANHIEALVTVACLVFGVDSVKFSYDIYGKDD